MIRQARFEDSGEYTCSAKNLKGSINSTFWIEVKGGTVLIHINEKEFWFIIETNVRLFFSLLQKLKKDDSHFPNPIYGFLKHVKKGQFI